MSTPKYFLSDANFDFMGFRNKALALSAVLLVVAVVSLASKGITPGLDFSGGALIQVSYQEEPDLAEVRTALESAGIEDAVVQTFGSNNDIAIRLQVEEGSSATISETVVQTLDAASDTEVTLQRQEFVGPQVGDELANQGGLAMLYVLIGIFIYIAVRFEWKFSAGAVAALVHDVTITLGFFSLLGIEFDLTTLAALLAVIGYSLNDTIVVFDRIRENFRLMRKAEPREVINTSVNQTLSRTIVTSGTTMMVLVALYLLGGDIIQGFALALLIGVGVGTYSSIFIAATLIMMLGVTKQDLMPVEKEGADAENPLP
jgi:preprotein translocase subunit SecF